ncbi:MAG: response regulator receiver modulated diguanylate cyclase [Phycisphaerales bacterium]|nr:response regulator receiver modulated diguanylate cyclase [Phycisphaerales bacterium]
MNTSNCEPCLTVLLVDDDPVSLALLEDHLAACGHRVVTASTATGAIEVLGREAVHIVIADWVMPVMNGLDLCRWVRGRAFRHPLHFVMLTAHAERAKLLEAFAAGADDFLTKPLQEAELLARLRAWTRFVRLQADLADRHRQAARLNEELAVANAGLARSNVRLTELATQDDLTLLPNRREAMRRLDEQWAIALRYDQPLACAAVDVDRFKEVNDTFGHGAGDEVLRQVSARLRGACRTADWVFRLGGDEFLLLLPNCDLSAAAACAERCRASVAAHRFSAGDELRCTISVGLAELTAAVRSPQDLLRKADQALYAAKRLGRNAVRSATAGGHSAPLIGGPK